MRPFISPRCAPGTCSRLVQASLGLDRPSDEAQARRHQHDRLTQQLASPTSSPVRSVQTVARLLMVAREVTADLDLYEQGWDVGPPWQARRAAGVFAALQRSLRDEGAAQTKRAAHGPGCDPPEATQWRPSGDPMVQGSAAVLGEADAAYHRGHTVLPWRWVAGLKHAQKLGRAMRPAIEAHTQRGAAGWDSALRELGSQGYSAGMAAAQAHADATALCAGCRKSSLSLRSCFVGGEGGGGHCSAAASARWPTGPLAPRSMQGRTGSQDEA